MANSAGSKKSEDTVCLCKLTSPYSLSLTDITRKTGFLDSQEAYDRYLPLHSKRTKI
ncbi:hypothetical protein PUN28_000600 [Cardiocondyla obscurior]|uniref:Uncharacterized protein n=1 Tax=Cardiocondyla obscurior TaxID=286306 RepID=A0AAW2H097_9HYME